MSTGWGLEAGCSERMVQGRWQQGCTFLLLHGAQCVGAAEGWGLGVGRETCVPCNNRQIGQTHNEPNNPVVVSCMLLCMHPIQAHSLVSAMVQSIKSMGAAAAAPTAAQGGIGHVAARGGAGSSTGGSAGGSTGSSSSSSGGGNGGARKPAPRFNYLHLRLENDWVEHCK